MPLKTNSLFIMSIQHNTSLTNAFSTTRIAICKTTALSMLTYFHITKLLNYCYFNNLNIHFRLQPGALATTSDTKYILIPDPAKLALFMFMWCIDVVSLASSYSVMAYHMLGKILFNKFLDINEQKKKEEKDNKKQEYIDDVWRLVKLFCSADVSVLCLFKGLINVRTKHKYAYCVKGSKQN